MPFITVCYSFKYFFILPWDKLVTKIISYWTPWTYPSIHRSGLYSSGPIFLFTDTNNPSFIPLWNHYKIKLWSYKILLKMTDFLCCVSLCFSNQDLDKFGAYIFVCTSNHAYSSFGEVLKVYHSSKHRLSCSLAFPAPKFSNSCCFFLIPPHLKQILGPQEWWEVGFNRTANVSFRINCSSRQ